PLVTWCRSSTEPPTASSRSSGRHRPARGQAKWLVGLPTELNPGPQIFLLEDEAEFLRLAPGAGGAEDAAVVFAGEDRLVVVPKRSPSTAALARLSSSDMCSS